MEKVGAAIQDELAIPTAKYRLSALMLPFLAGHLEIARRLTPKVILDFE